VNYLEKIKLSEQDAVQKKIENIFNLSEVARYLFMNQIVILIISTHIKSNEWPIRNKVLDNEPTKEIPIIWSLLYAADENDIEILYDIQPGKCLPSKYKNENRNFLKNKIKIEINDRRHGPLAGCPRYCVTQNSHAYAINPNIPKYCSIFGLPDDCYTPEFEEKMITELKSHIDKEIWCLNKTDYLESIIEGRFKIDIKYMKNEFLPARNFPYVNSSKKFLRALYSQADLDFINKESWYNYGFQLFKDMGFDLDGRAYRFENEALYYIKKKIIFENIRQLFLIKNKDRYENYKTLKPPSLDLSLVVDFQKDLNVIKNPLIEEKEKKLQLIIDEEKDRFDFEKFRSRRFLLMDVEYIHYSYPDQFKKRSFNLPCIISNIIWNGTRKGIKIEVNVLNLPCSFCTTKKCQFFRHNLINFNCLAESRDLYKEQINLLKNQISMYENFKIYSYGKSDFFQLEQLLVFYEDSSEIPKFERKNRKKDRRIIDISQDISINNTSLDYIEKHMIKKWRPKYRRDKKVNINLRFMTKYRNKNWKKFYKEAIEACIDDSISAFLFLLMSEFKIS